MSAYDTLILGHANLIHYWQFDELAGTSAADSKGVLNGTISTGARAPTLGQSGLPSGGKAFLFNGDTTHHDSNVSMSTFAVGGTAGLTLEGWVFLPTARPGQTAQLAAWTDSGGGSFSGILKLEAGDQVDWSVNGGSGIIVSNVALSRNVWHHIVGTAATSGQLLLYIDGIQQTATGTCTTIYNNANSLPFFVGGGGAYAFDATFPITRIAAYNAPLSGATVLAHYNAGIAVPGSSKLAGRGGGLVSGGRTGRSGLVA